jgi:hypothetical protein
VNEQVDFHHIGSGIAGGGGIRCGSAYDGHSAWLPTTDYRHDSFFWRDLLAVQTFREKGKKQWAVATDLLGFLSYVRHGNL